MHKHGTVWVVDDDSSIRWVLERALNQAGIANESFDSGDRLLERIGSEQPDAIISDIRMPGTDGLQLLSWFHDNYPELPVIITTAHSDLDSAVASTAHTPAPPWARAAWYTPAGPASASTAAASFACSCR